MKRFLYYSLCSAVFFAFVMASCKNSTQKDTETQEEVEETEDETLWDGVPLEEKDTRSLKLRFDEKIDLVNISWKNMLAADDEKIRHSQKIVSELNKIPKFKQQKLAKIVMDLVSEIENSRYDRQSMTDAQHMNEYDKTLDELIAAVQKLKKKSKKFDNCEVCKYEYKWLMENNQNDAILRSKHDSYAKAYNQMLSKNRAEIEKIAESYHNLELEPIFNYGE